MEAGKETETETDLRDDHREGPGLIPVLFFASLFLFPLDWLIIRYAKRESAWQLLPIDYGLVTQAFAYLRIPYAWETSEYAILTGYSLAVFFLSSQNPLYWTVVTCLSLGYSGLQVEYDYLLG